MSKHNTIYSASIIAWIVLSYVLFLLTACQAVNPSQTQVADVIVGAERFDRYVHKLKGKNVGLVVNHSSLIGPVTGETHLLDQLLTMNIDVKKIFTPEHGFRGMADAGEKVESNIDQKTGLTIISLYGSHRQPTRDDLEGLDIVVFDIQDVGARFYTYISTMHYVMEACAENKKPFIVLDRPNPNGFYVDGPVLEPEFQSFVGMHPVPIVHGMTVGEYAQMINGEGWLEGGLTCDLTVVTCKNYDHNTFYQVRTKPSPNLPNMTAIYLYPSLCLFEGTAISVGRGTSMSFQVIGHPALKNFDFSFTPKSMEGAKEPKLEDQVCYGLDLSEIGKNFFSIERYLNLTWLLDFYKRFPDKDNFFNSFFEKLAGTGELRRQIQEEKSEEEIKESWQPGLEKFRETRKKYLLYEDF